MAAGKLALLALCALLVAVECRVVRRSPDDSHEESWLDKAKGTFSDAVDSAKKGVSDLGGKISELGDSFKKSDTYEKVSTELHNAGDKLSDLGTNIKESDAFQGAKNAFNKAAQNIKDSDAYKGVEGTISRAADNVKEKLDD